MLLALDIGNTNVTCGLFKKSRLLHTFRLGVRPAATSDEYAVALRGLLELRAVAPEYVESVVLVSVVPSLTTKLEAAVKRGFGVQANVVGQGLSIELDVVCDAPESVGADRLVNAYAARRLLQPSGEQNSSGLVVVDFGTATTFDCVSPLGQFLGGAIAPGLISSLEGLVAKAARLQSVELVAPSRALGRNTLQAMQSGIVLGHACMVDGMVARLRAELEFDCQVIATGGLGELIAPQSRQIDRMEADLTLQGLSALFEQAVLHPD